MSSVSQLSAEVEFENSVAIGELPPSVSRDMKCWGSLVPWARKGGGYFTSKRRRRLLIAALKAMTNALDFGISGDPGRWASDRRQLHLLLARINPHQADHHRHVAEVYRLLANSRRGRDVITVSPHGNCDAVVLETPEHEFESELAEVA
jgi:hypothetical protein